MDRTNKVVLSADGANGPIGPIEVIPLRDHLAGNLRPAILLLFGAVGFLLLIACVNVANMLMARAVAREREMVIRFAVGAAHWRILRQLLTESTLLAVTGGALGLIFAYGGAAALVRAAPSDAVGNFLRAARVGIDREVLAFMLLVSVITGIIFGLVPAFNAARTNLAGALKDSSPAATTSIARRRIRSLLMMTEVALALVLLAGAGLLLRSFYSLASVDPGFRPYRMLTFTISLGMISC